MKEEYVTDLETSKILKECGVKQMSEFYWQWNCVTGKYCLRTLRTIEDVRCSICPYGYNYPAFTLSELKELASEFVINKEYTWYGVNCQFKEWGRDKSLHMIPEIQAWAEYVMYLLERSDK